MTSQRQLLWQRYQSDEKLSQKHQRRVQFVSKRSQKEISSTIQRTVVTHFIQYAQLNGLKSKIVAHLAIVRPHFLLPHDLTTATYRAVLAGVWKIYYYLHVTVFCQSLFLSGRILCAVRLLRRTDHTGNTRFLIPILWSSTLCIAVNINHSP